MRFKLMLKSLIFSLFLFSVAPSQAARDDGGLFVEPGLLYQVSDGDVQYPGTSGDADTNGFGILARLGFHIDELFFAGVDGRYIFNDFSDSNNNYDVDAKSYNLAPVVGLQMSEIGLRVWGAYVLLGQMDPDGQNNFDVKYDQATGYRIGAGFRLYSLSLNLEYEAIDYGSTEVEAFGSFPVNSTTDSFNLDTESWILSVSFPMEI